MTGAPLPPFLIEPILRERVWGGARFRKEGLRIGEAWIVFEQNRVLSGEYAGLLLGEVAATLGENLVGSNAYRPGDVRFPLLIKLLDTADWLSIQVHPDDQIAANLEGEAERGKTEAWHFLEAPSGSEIIAGVTESISGEELDRNIYSGDIESLLAHRQVHPGDTVLIEAGLIHALGPDLLIYEVQQNSDLTYRVFDWHRPATAGRELHPEKSIASTKPEIAVNVMPLPVVDHSASVRLISCDYFQLEAAFCLGEPVVRSGNSISFEAITATDSNVHLTSENWSLKLEPFQTAIVPAGGGTYAVQSPAATRCLIASVP